MENGDGEANDDNDNNNRMDDGDDDSVGVDEVGSLKSLQFSGLNLDTTMDALTANLFKAPGLSNRLQ